MDERPGCLELLMWYFEGFRDVEEERSYGYLSKKKGIRNAEKWEGEKEKWWVIMSRPVPKIFLGPTKMEIMRNVTTQIFFIPPTRLRPFLRGCIDQPLVIYFTPCP